MQVMKWSVMALAVAAGTTQLAMASAQSESKGFVEDSSLNVLNRNLYFNRDFRDRQPGAQSKVEEWGHGLITTFESGFTQGTVGIGVDAFGLVGLKLDSGRGRVGTGVLQGGTFEEEKANDDYAKAGGAIKLRISNTVIKYGDQFVALPVLATDDSRLLPETAEGFLITSNEIEGLELNAGRFTAGKGQADVQHDSLEISKIDLIGGTYQITEDMAASLYYAKTQDAFRKYYGNLNYNLPLSDTQALAFDFNIYDTKSKGDGTFAWDGDKVDSTVWSLSGAYSVGAHTFTLAHQRNHGDGGYPYGDTGQDFGGTVFLANSVQRSDFFEEGEKSWQARYDLNMASFGVPGLSFMTRYVKGDDAKTSRPGESKEWERDIEAKYVFQEGAAKDLSLRVRQATYRANYRDDIDEVRVIVEYPLSIL
jgi:imipenem/basic amino acid-specific outer membrane pore